MSELVAQRTEHFEVLCQKLDPVGRYAIKNHYGITTRQFTYRFIL